MLLARKKINAMENRKKILLVSGLGILAEHLVSTAIALKRFPEAQVAFASMGVLPDVLDTFKPSDFSEVHLLGIGLAAADPARLETSFSRLVARKLMSASTRMIPHMLHTVLVTCSGPMENRRLVSSIRSPPDLSQG